MIPPRWRERLRAVALFRKYVEPPQVICNGRLLGTSKPIGRAGQRLAHWLPAYHFIPAGFIYVGSGHPSGFDSRYYGPIAIERLQRMEKVL